MTTWFITGVGGGLGRALAKAGLDRGDRVAGTVRRPTAVDEFEALAPGSAHGFLADMTDEASIHAAVEGAEAALGGIDILVNNAGYPLVGAIEEASLAEVRALLEVNLIAPIAAIQAALPHFRRRRAGHVINISSVSGLAPWAGTGIYGASKYALEAIGQTLAQEVAEFGIRVTNVEPGSIRTEFAGRSLTVTARKISAYDQGARNAERQLSAGSGKQAGDPAKVAAAILQIAGASDAPLQLLLGADAVHYATQAAARFQEEFGRFASLSLSTAYSDR